MKNVLFVYAMLLCTSCSHIGEHIQNQAAHNSKILCSAVFVSKRNIDEAYENSVRLKIPGDSYMVENNSLRFTSLGVTRKSLYIEEQGCIAMPKGQNEISFAAVKTAPDTAEMKDMIRSIDPLLQSSIDSQFLKTDHHAALLVIQHGNIIAEKYANGFSKETKFESWSMGKSLTAALIGVLIQQGHLSLDQPAPIKEWSQDERAQITIANLLNMSSGLRFSGMPMKKDGGLDIFKLIQAPLPDHISVYSGINDVFSKSINAPLEFEPNTVGRYRNCDPLILGAIIKRIVEDNGEQYLSWPQKYLFDPLGTTDFVLETDPSGNFILSGFDYGTAEAWGRLGQLFLQNGVWNEQQLIPNDFVDFVSTAATAWEKPEYGGLFWIDQSGAWLPADTYYMNGSGRQRVYIIPSLDAVIVRFGYTAKGDWSSFSDLITTVVDHLKINPPL